MDQLFKALPQDLQWEVLTEFTGTHSVRNGKLIKKNFQVLKYHNLTYHSTIEERQQQKYYCNDCDQVFFCSLYMQKHMNGKMHKNLILALKLEKELIDKIKID